MDEWTDERSGDRIDDAIRDLAGAARDRVEASVDVDAAWASRPRFGAGLLDLEARSPRRRTAAITRWTLTAAAVVAAVVAAGAVIAVRSGSDPVPSVAAPTVRSVATSPGAATTVAISPATTVPTAPAPTTTIAEGTTDGGDPTVVDTAATIATSGPATAPATSPTVPPTTTRLPEAADETAGEASSWRGFPSEVWLTDVCPDGICPQLTVMTDGASYVHDAGSGTLTRLTVPELTTRLPPAYREHGAPWVLRSSPDGVLLLASQPTEAAGPHRDLVAVELFDDGSFAELARWPDVIDTTGDSELVPTAEGLVSVETTREPIGTRPDPGQTPVATWAAAGIELDPNDTAHAITVDVDDDTVRVARGSLAWSVSSVPPRGMPPVWPTFDGGVVVFTDTAFATIGGGLTFVRGWPDGTTSEVVLSEYPVAVDPTGTFVYRDGDDLVRVRPFDDRSPRWDGRELDGSIDLDELDADIAANDPDWAYDPVTLADAVLAAPAINELRTTSVTEFDDGGATVVATTSNLFDDSVAAERTTLELTSTPSGAYRVAALTDEWICQPGRGQQRFDTALCT